MTQLTLFDNETESRFQTYLAENPQVWEAFKKFTFQAINAGRTRLSAEVIVNQIRWNTIIREKGEFKINNSYKPFLARLFMNEFPEHKGFFELRKSVADAEMSLDK